VLEPGNSDRIVNSAHLAKAGRMVTLGQATWVGNGRAIRLTGEGEKGEDDHGRTHTARGGLLGIIGRGQHYTQENRAGRVTGFRKIWPQDRGTFNMATLECMAK
jgi:hypothetical protein